MKHRLTPGAELDIATPAELRAMLSEYIAPRLPLEVMRGAETGRTDGTGALSLGFYTVPQGWEFSLHRLLVDADGFSFAAPFTSAAGSVEIKVSDERRDGINLGSPGLPAIWTEGSSSAIVARNADILAVVLIGGPASTGISARFQGTLTRYEGATIQ